MDLLDHRYQGSTMYPVEIRHGMEYVNLCNKNVAPVVSKYVAKIAPYFEILLLFHFLVKKWAKYERSQSLLKGFLARILLN